MDELYPRVDLEKLVAATNILSEAKSDAWKSRKEALELLQSILDVGANKRLKPNIGVLLLSLYTCLKLLTNCYLRR